MSTRLDQATELFCSLDNDDRAKILDLLLQKLLGIPNPTDQQVEAIAELCAAEPDDRRECRLRLGADRPGSKYVEWFCENPRHWRTMYSDEDVRPASCRRFLVRSKRARPRRECQVATVRLG